MGTPSVASLAPASFGSPQRLTVYAVTLCTPGAALRGSCNTGDDAPAGTQGACPAGAPSTMNFTGPGVVFLKEYWFMPGTGVPSTTRPRRNTTLWTPQSIVHGMIVARPRSVLWAHVAKGPMTLKGSGPMSSSSYE